MAMILAACLGAPSVLSSVMLSSAALASSVGLVCDGEYRTQAESVDSVAEDMFGGTMHVALVENEGRFVEVRLQPYEGDVRMPIQTYALTEVRDDAPADESGGDVAAIPGLVTSGKLAGADNAAQQMPADDLRIDATADAITPSQSTERGPIIRARVDGKPLVPTREVVATVTMRLDRIDGSLSLVWGESRVKDHKIPGAIRPSKIQLRDEKSYDAVCMPVRQRTF